MWNFERFCCLSELRNTLQRRFICVGYALVRMWFSLDTYGSECISIEYNLAIESSGDMESNGTRIEKTNNHLSTDIEV